MLCESQKINRYGAKFFIGQMVTVKVQTYDGFGSVNFNKCGVINGVTGSVERGFQYSLWPTQSSMTAWFNESDLDFVNPDEREEFEKNYSKIAHKSE